MQVSNLQRPNFYGVVTICKHDEKDDNRQSPLEKNAECDQGDNDIDQSRDDIEQYQLRSNSELASR